MRWEGKVPKPPAGTWGVAVQVQEAGAATRATIAVAANWGNQSAPIFVLTEDGTWRESGAQVADYRHNPYVAVDIEVARYWAMSSVPKSRRRYTRYIQI